MSRRTAKKVVDGGHIFTSVIGFEDLWSCARCGGSEGTLTDECPGVHMPPHVRTLVFRGVVNFSEGRWVGENSPARRTRRAIQRSKLFGVTLQDACNATKAMGRAILNFGGSTRGQ